MSKPHAKLRGAMMANDIDSTHLANKLLRGSVYISQRMMGKQPWTLDECYQILDMLHIPYEMLPEYFPPKGRPA